MMFTELRILPSFHPACELQFFEEDGVYSLAVYYKAADHTEASATIDFTDTAAAKEIFRLSEGIIRTSRRDDRLILDGVSLVCTMELDGEDKSYDFRCPAQGTSEWKLVHLYLQYIFRYSTDDALIRAMEKTVQYFDGFMPFRTYDGDVFRLRMHGRITRWQKKEFDAVVKATLKHDTVVLDMSHLDFLDEYLLEALKPFQDKTNVTWWVRRRFIRELVQAGFSETAMLWISQEPEEPPLP